MINKKTWKIETDRDKMEKLIKYNKQQYHKKRLFEKNFLLRMIAFKTRLDLIGKFT